ncbi:exonuclease domain-containing protein [Azospirillum rugosum]|uniref:DNA polymerase-3 subunit epsilon n=1 Tax=Azospirillum rugosum TaxID=416170 RepID=A0ABS4SQ31_9PROT|nr:exonuclease domain-containing protein [Azospirillum rugosum]MBP2293500.1 DNA polymerase-3 subunit epsilon [Azospirillum rugosum]MDQ0529179.1 DNA polymerase-3 subunit epsilon [Azospirillum rugosum]
MAGGAWRSAVLGLAVAGLAFAYLGMDIGRLVGDDREAYYTDMGAVALGVVALWAAFARLGRHFREVERLRDALAAPRGRLAVDLAKDARDDEAGRLAKAAAEALRHDRPGAAAGGGARLTGVMAALEEPVVVLDDFGRVELLNAAAAGQLGIAVGADIYDHLSRPELFRAIERARESGQMVSALLRRAQGGEIQVRVRDLGLQAGVALVFPARSVNTPALLAGDRVVLRPLSRAPHLGDEEPLLTLPMVSLWVATTGEADGDDRAVVAVGTVRLAGPRVFRSLSLDLFVDPGRPIPAEATARHGVTDAMVQGARSFAESWPVIAEALHGCMVVGLDVDAALDALERDFVRAGPAGTLERPTLERPLSLDLGRLATALDRSLEGAPLDRLCAAFGIAPHPRPDVFAPALIQAELAAAILLQLDGRGIDSHGAARAFAEGQVQVQRR